MQQIEHYERYVQLCNAHGMRPLSYTAWSNMFPLTETFV